LRLFHGILALFSAIGARDKMSHLLIARMKLLRSYKRRKLIGAARAGCATEFPSG
jgi:hypothetical protein